METWAPGRIVEFASYTTLDELKHKKWFVLHIANIASTSTILDQASQCEKYSVKLMYLLVLL